MSTAMPPVRILREFLGSVYEPGTIRLSPQRLAGRLGVEPQALIAGRLDPDEIQHRLHGIVRVISRAVAIQTDLDRALDMLHAPIPSLDDRSLLDLARTDRADLAMDYLRSISSGFAG